MRIVKEINDKACKITVYSWNGKYLIKLEEGPLEQTFKVSELDVLEEEIGDILNDTFMEEAIKRFQEMRESLKQSMSNI